MSGSAWSMSGRTGPAGCSSSILPRSVSTTRRGRSGTFRGTSSARRIGRRVDLSLAKNTRFGGNKALEFRVDVINLTAERLNRLDTAQQVAANNLLTSPTVGSIPPYANMFNPRSVQLGLRFTY